MSNYDDNARQLITSCLDKNFIVEAGAGSGKTTALVKRLVSLVEKNPFSISEISCITFTKAAADEFFKRFQELLAKRTKPSDETKKLRAGDLPYTTEKSRENCKIALKNINLCFMGTIDSFIEKLINEHPYEFNIPANIPVIDDDKQCSYIRGYYLEILKGIYDNKIPGLSSLVKKASQYLSKNDDFVYGIQKFLKLRATDLVVPQLPDVYYDLDDKFKIEKSQLFGFLSSFKNDVFVQIKKLYKYNKDLPYYEKLIHLNWEYNSSRVLKALNELSSIHFKKSDIDDNTTHPENYHLVLDELGKNYFFEKSVIDNLIDNINNEISLYVYNALYLSAKIVAEKIRENGLFVFSDFIINVRDALKSDAQNGGKLIKYIQKTRKYYFLDEAQDTNPISNEIFFYLTAISPTEKYSDCHPIPGSLFIVGDPKQSIYRFNGADYSAFLNLEKLFELDSPNSQVLKLSRNFRSTIQLRKYFNSMMPETFNTETDKVEYPSIPEEIYNNRDEQTYLEGAYSYDDYYSPGKSAKSDVKKVVNIIKTLVNNNQYKISYKNDKDECDTRTLTYDDFMIITPGKPVLGEYLREFTKNDIPCFIEGASLFDESEALAEIKILFKFLVMPNNKNYFYDALTSKYIGTNESEISEFISLGYKLSISNDINSEDKNKSNFFDAYDKLIQLYENTLYMSYSGKFLYLIENTEIFNRYKCAYFEYLYYAYDLIKDAEKDNNLNGPEEIIEYLNSINSANRNLERCFSIKKNKNGQVHLANLHKTKGLEAPVVILAAPKKNVKDKIEFRTERDSNGTKTYIFGIQKQQDFAKSYITQSTLYGKSEDYENKVDSKYRNELDSMESERRRLEYVAATRAKNLLLVSRYFKTTQKGTEREEGYWDELLYKDMPSFEPFIEENRKINSTKDVKSAQELYCAESLSNAESNKNSYYLKKPSSLVKDSNVKIKVSTDPEIINNEELIANNNDATIKGTLVHRLMELLVNSKGKYTFDDVLCNIKNDFTITIDDQNLLKNVFNTIKSGGYKQLNGTVNDDILSILLNTKSVICECPFAFLDNRYLYNGFIDVIYEDKNGDYHIIDYKTNEESDVLKLEEYYKSQLDGYIKSAKEILGKDISIDAHIYHIKIK